MKSLIEKLWNIFSSLFLYAIALTYVKLFRINYSHIWLLSERGNDARDNGWHFYNYLKKEHPEISVKYVITKKSQDLNRIAPEDRIKYRSFKHYVLFLTAGKLISTHIMGFSPEFSLFWRLDKKGLVKTKGKRVMLQHGITKDYIDIMTANVSKLDLFICGAKPEYDYILNNYGYDESVVKYTGFARFDAIVDESKKHNQILVMPTWRKYLKYENNFKETKYFKAWQSFLNNPELIKYLEDHKTKLVFYPHYEMQKFISDFTTKSKNIVLAKIKDFDVQRLLKESKLLITDYSSVFFDFAYMKKPVIYYQFDQKEYRKSHYEQGYFDYERDGFGPVTKDEKKLVLEIKNTDTMSDDYIKQRNIYFNYSDDENNKRIFNAINKA